MNPPSATALRQQFIDFFVDKYAHTFVASSPVVPQDDPTLLFTNAGMNQFKDVFLGLGDRAYNRAVNTQKCIRVSGKHNDLEEVGKDIYHHTFFEMLGNWSFGDYFKKEAIGWAWELLTEVWGLPKERLYATVFAGDPDDGVPADDEAALYWTQVTDIDHSHISRWDKKDNFWEMANTGPCGPNSEIHIDLTADCSGAQLVNVGDPRVIELWNLVFIQFNRLEGGALADLPAKHVDTGMGLERIAAVVKQLDDIRAGRPVRFSNYGTGLFVPIIEATEKLASHRYGAGANAKDRYDADDPENMKDVACRVIADHMRMLTFAIAEGGTPSNEGRGYVVRRILRRAARYGRQYLDLVDPFLHQLVPTVAEVMGAAFAEIKPQISQVAGIIEDEESGFGRTLDRGIALFEEAAERGGDRISGEDAFKLHDTYGFPLDLTQLMAEENELGVDVQGFDTLMTEAREKARAGGTFKISDDTLVQSLAQGEISGSEFLGYEADEVNDAQIVLVDPGTLRQGEQGVIVLDRTPFYAESGGQVGDTGTIRCGDGATFKVTNTQRVAAGKGDVICHFGTVSTGEIQAAVGPVVATVDNMRRDAIRRHHTGTHLLNFALRKVLGGSVDQRGSLVGPDYLRFDFTHNKPVDGGQLGEVESIVNGLIAEDLPVQIQVMSQDEGRKIPGLRAVFGEKYGQTVRVVCVGTDDPVRTGAADFSVEFCGGTHLSRTGESLGFLVTTEEAVAKGVRRIIAITGPGVEQARGAARQLNANLGRIKQLPPDDLAQGVALMNDAMNQRTIGALVRNQIRAELEQLQLALKAHRKQQAAENAADLTAIGDELLASGEKLNGATMIVGEVPIAPVDQIRRLIDRLKKKAGSAAIVLATIDASKGSVMLLAAATDDLVAKGVHAGNIVGEAAAMVGGKGGGRPNMAQAGGKQIDQLQKALQHARQLISAQIG